MILNFLVVIVVINVATAINLNYCTLNSVWTVAGSGADVQSEGLLSAKDLAADGVGLNANLFNPTGIFFNPNGLEYYVSDSDPTSTSKYFSQIRKVQTTGGISVAVSGDSASSANLPTSGVVTTIGKSNDFSIFYLIFIIRWIGSVCYSSFSSDSINMA